MLRGLCSLAGACLQVVSRAQPLLAIGLATMLLTGCQSAQRTPAPTVTPVALASARSNPVSGLQSDSETLPLSVASTTAVTVTEVLSAGEASLSALAVVDDISLTDTTSLSSTLVFSRSDAAPLRETPTPISPGVVVLAPEDAPTIAPTPTVHPTPEVGTVMQVVDGDTLLVRIGDTSTLVGYLLVRAPGLDEPLGELALDVNRSLVEGAAVRLERDISDIDRDHRHLRLVYLNDGTLVNAELLRQGWAQVEASPLDKAYVAQFTEIEQGARSAGVGMWAGLAHSVTTQGADVYGGPDLTFPVMQTLPINSVLAIDGVTPDLEWYRLEGGWWIESRFVANAPEVEEVALAVVDTPVPTATTTNTPTPTATPTVSPTPTFAIGSVEITYIDKKGEWLEIRNGTDRLLDLRDWKILSERGGEICTLAGQLAPLATMIVWSQWGPNFACNMEFPMWDDLLDDSALLYSPSGFVIYRYEDPMNLPAAVETDQ